ncbi:MAG: glycosyltransferase family 25 protein [Rhodocyclaceae bacterium]|nr:glycosyltransferase family 25 protein [Rhodocyclaceae bacterium]
MHCIYINLDRQTERRAFVEENFDVRADPDWTLHRFDAVDAGRLPQRCAAGALRPSEKAAFASHFGAVEKSLDYPGATLILEDDVWFGPRAAEMLNAARAELAGKDWDLLFTDVCVVAPPAMLDLFLMRRAWEQHRQATLLNLQRMPFAGATAYLVNAGAKQKLLAMLKEHERLDVPYDLVLRNLIQQGRLSAFVVFPFATSLSAHAEASQIQLQDTAITDACWNAFRRLVCADADSDELAVSQWQAAFGERYRDPRVEALCDILGLCLSPKLPAK